MNKLKIFSRKIFVLPVVAALLKFKIHPTVITIGSLFFAFPAAFFYYRGIFWLGAIFFIIAGILDTFDGEVARRTNRITKFGGFLDSTIDRINEFIIYLGLFSFYYRFANDLLFWIMLAMFGSMMVSYTRAKGESLGISPQVGIFERFTRCTILTVGSFAGKQLMSYFLILLALGTIQTALQRIFYVSRYKG